MEDSDLQQSLKDWAELSKEYADLRDLHKRYLGKLDEMIALQKKCISGVHHQRYRLNAIRKMMSVSSSSSPDDSRDRENLDRDIMRRKAQLSQMEDTLPRPSGRYLTLILGAINVSILDKKAKYDYKDQYERFKLIVNLVGCVLAILSLYFQNRILDLLFMFLTVWYYCTLTIRESILRVNGSRIKGWWRAHHFISTFAGGILLIWPDGTCYQDFRGQMMCFNVYVAFLQYLQFTYQRGVLYRLRSFGERRAMDITINGFHSWMWKGLGFLLPFLYAGYIYQLYNSYTLFHLSFRDDATWQVPCLAVVFAVLGSGNIITTSWVIPAKIIERRKGLLKMRFTRLDKFFWRHRRRTESETAAINGNVGLQHRSDEDDEDRSSSDSDDSDDIGKKTT